MRILLISCILTFFYSFLVAQSSPRALKRAGNAYFENYKYLEAFKAFQQYHQLKPKNKDILQSLGISSYHANQLILAEKYLQQAIALQKEPAPEALFFLAKTYHLAHRFSEAVTVYKQFLKNTKSTHPLTAMVKDDIKRCGYAIRISADKSLVIVENLGKNVNSSGNDFAPILSPNYQSRLYFASNRVGNIGGLCNEAGSRDDKFGYYRSDIYRTEISDGTWAATTPMTGLLNSKENDLILDFNKNGQVMYFFQSKDLFAGQILVDTFTTSGNKALQNCTLKSPVQAELGDNSLFFYKDNLLIFASRREGGYGGVDLYWTDKRNGIWSIPQNMGSTINSAYDETSPFLAKDGRTLYFSSNHSQRSIGDFDIFKTTFQERQGRWSTPENLGLPINSGGSDLYFRLSEGGYQAFFASHRQESIGEQDIFSVYFKEYQKEQLKNSSLAFYEISNTTNFANQSDKKNKQITDNQLNTIKSTYDINSLFFKNEKDILNIKNRKELSQLASLLLKHPSLQVILSSHSDQSESPKIDLLFSIKRAEKVKDYLTTFGINTQRISVQGVGANYPIAKESLDGQINLFAQKMNRRVDIKIINPEKLPIEINTLFPQIDAHMSTTDFKFYKNATNGLSYRVQIASSPQMYNGNLLDLYQHPMIDKHPSKNLYRYTVGLYQTYNSASQLQEDIVNNGVSGAFVVAYVNGLRLNDVLIEKYKEQYKDLQYFINDK